jgi:hypothetical protein
MKATISDIKEADGIVTESMRAKRGSGTYSDRMEDIMLNYDNVRLEGVDLVIRLSSGVNKSVWDYV